MSERLENQAEIVKLARLLSVDSAELAFLAELPSRALRDYREAATERLFEADAEMFHRVGAAARLIPAGLIASIAERAFGPLLCARAAGAVETSKALDVLGRLPPEFVADATIEVDPRRVVELIAAVQEETVVPVARILGERREYVTMGRFLAFVPDHVIVSAIGALSDEALLRTAFVLEHKERLDHAVGLLPADRLPGVIVHASELGLWPEALDLLGHLSDERRKPIADVVAAQDEAVIADLVAAVSAAGIWDSLLPVVRLMSEEGLQRLAAVPAFHDPAILSGIITAIADLEEGLWRDLAPLVRALPADVRRTVTRIAAGLDPERLERIVADAARAPDSIAPLVALIADMEEKHRRRVGEVVARVAEREPGAVSEIVRAAAHERFWRQLAPLIAVLRPETVSAAAAAAAELDEDELARVIRDAVEAPEALPQLVDLIGEMPAPSHERLASVVDGLPAALVAEMLSSLRTGREDELLDRLPPRVRTAVLEAAVTA